MCGCVFFYQSLYTYIISLYIHIYVGKPSLMATQRERKAQLLKRIKQKHLDKAKQQSQSPKEGNNNMNDYYNDDDDDDDYDTRYRSSLQDNRDQNEEENMDEAIDEEVSSLSPRSVAGQKGAKAASDQNDQNDEKGEGDQAKDDFFATLGMSANDFEVNEADNPSEPKTGVAQVQIMTSITLITLITLV